MLTKEQARKQLSLRRKHVAKPFLLEEFLFPEQLAFVLDEARSATACCSVRAGKTVAIAADLISTALNNPRTVGLYITLSRASAKKLVFPELRKIIKDYNLPAKPNVSQLSVEFANGSVIYCTGASTEAEVDKLRGLSRVAVAYIDEAQAFRAHIKEMVEQVLVKRLYDLNGRMRLCGTPGPVLAGWFYDSCHSEAWSHHHWTMHSNPWLIKTSGKTPDELVAQDCATRGVSITDPGIQRECFGRWVYDPNSLLLQYDAERNDYDNLPPGVYTYILGIDLGVRDSDSLSLLAFSDRSATTYLVEEIVTPNQLTDDLAIQINKLSKTYNIGDMPVDAGGLGLKVVEDLKHRYGLPLVPADKQGKMVNYRLLNNALMNGTFKAKKSSRFAQDCNVLERDNDRSTPDRIVVKGHSDAVDSCLYAFKLSPAYSYVPPVPKTQAGSPEYLREQEELHLQAAMDRVKKQKDAEAGNQFGNWNKDAKGVPDWNKW